MMQCFQDFAQDLCTNYRMEILGVTLGVVLGIFYVGVARIRSVWGDDC
jgi:hypothetical protein